MTTKPRANSRQKGAAFEREIARELYLHTGISFTRNLDQYQTSGLGDLTPDNPAWPFLIECKRYATGTACKPEWRKQAISAAAKAGLLPAVIYRYDRRDVVASVPFTAFDHMLTDDPPPLADCDYIRWADITLDGFVYLAREIMATRALSVDARL